MTLNFLDTTSVNNSKYGSIELRTHVKKSSSKDEIKLRHKHRNIQKAKITAGNVLKLGTIATAGFLTFKNPQKVGKLIGSALKFGKSSLSLGFELVKTFVKKIPSVLSTVIKNAK